MGDLEGSCGILRDLRGSWGIMGNGMGRLGNRGIGGLGDWGIKAKVIVESCGILGDLGGS